MRMPWRPVADYMRSHPRVEPFSDESVPTLDVPEPMYRPEDYEAAWKIIDRRGRPDNDPEQLKAIIVGMTEVQERYMRALANPDLRQKLLRHCIFDRSNLQWLIADPRKAVNRRLSRCFATPGVPTLNLAWTTHDKTVAIEAAMALNAHDEDIVTGTVTTLFFGIIRKSQDGVDHLQDKLREIAVREFQCVPVKTGDDQQPIRAYSLTCSTCGTVEHFKGIKFGPDKASEIVPKHFKQKGWVLHNRRDDQDQCPDCVNAKTLARRAERGLPVPPAPGEATVEITSSATPLKTMGDLKKVVSIRPIPKTAEAPAMTASLVPTRAQNRLMQDAIAKVYPVAEQGYAKGASDHTVAATLDLPVDWIRQHREQFFGPPERIDLSTTEQRLAALKNRMTDLEEKGLKALADLKAQVEAREKAAIAEIETMKRIVKETEDKTLADIDACRDEITDLGKEMDDVRRRLGDVA